MTISEARTWITLKLSEKYPHHEASVLALYLLSWALSQSSAKLLSSPQKLLTTSEIDILSRTIKEHLTDHKPLQYCIGSVPFLSAIIKVRPPILIPRPETEYWVALMIQHLQKLNRSDLILLDMCTGSGCIAISLAQAFPQATIYAVDLEPQALALAQENASLNQCTNVLFIESDLFRNLPTDLQFDCILSNPPYISKTEYKELDPDVLLWEDPKALLAEDDGLSCIKTIIKEAPQRLRRDHLFKQHHVPQLALEIGEYQADKIMKLMQQAGFTPHKYLDLAHKDRMIAGDFVHE